MKYNKEILEQVKRGEANEEALIMNLMAVNPLQDIVRFVVDTLIKEPTSTTPISVTMEEYERITSMFRIKGYKMISETGEYVAETRGRKPKYPFIKEGDTHTLNKE